MEAGWGKLTVQEALRGSSASSPRRWGSQALKSAVGALLPSGGNFSSNQLSGFQETSFQLLVPASVSLWVTDIARLLQGLHQGLIGLNTDLDFSPSCLIRCTRQLRLRLLQIGPGCLQRSGP